MRRYFVFPFIFYLAILLSACVDETVKQTNITDDILNNTASYYYIDTKSYPAKNKLLPIGIFDSGTGGLTVLDAIVNFDKFDNNNHKLTNSGDAIRDFNLENFIYLGDKANMPYGQYESFNKTALLKEHVIKDVQFLMSNKYYSKENTPYFSTDKQPVKAIVIACNTATAFAKDDVESFIKKAGLNLKVIGVIGAGVRGALSSINNNEDAGIAVFATAGTVSSNGYPKEIFKSLKISGHNGKIEVFQQAGVGLAGAVDGAEEYIDIKTNAPRKIYKGPSDKNDAVKINIAILSRYNFDWSGNNMLYDGTRETPENIQINSINNYISYHVVSLMESIKNTENAPVLKSIILGCTHYPFYTDMFKLKLAELYNLRENGNYVYRNLMIKNIPIIDPAINTAKELYEYLNAENLFNESSLMKSEFYISVANKDNPNNIIDEKGNFTYEYKYGRDAGNIQPYVKVVPFTRNNIGEETIKMLYDKAPFTYDLIKNFSRNNPKNKSLESNEKL
jgi:glutamate racemase